MKKRGIVTDYLPWLLIAVAALVIFVIAYIVLKDSGVSLIERIKEIFSGR